MPAKRKGRATTRSKPAPPTDELESESSEADIINWGDYPTLPLDKERALKKKGFSYVCGVDEAGRGPLAGRCCACE